MSLPLSFKSMVQSYLEGVGWGLEQLREARAELKEVSHALKKAGLESNRNTEGVKSLERLREVSVNHCQLLAAVSNLPRLYSGEMLLCGHTGMKSFIHDEFSFLFNLRKLVFILHLLYRDENRLFWGKETVSILFLGI